MVIFVALSDRWMTCGSTSFSKYFSHIHEDDGWVILKVVCNGTHFTFVKSLASSRDPTRDRYISMSALKLLCYRGGGGGGGGSLLYLSGLSS